MKNICFLNSTKSWGGGEKWHYEASTYMHSKGHNVLVVTNKESELYNKLKGSKVNSIPLKIGNFSFLNPFKIKKLKSILKDYKIEIIVINLSEDLKIGGLAAKQVGVDKIIYRRGSAIPIKNTFFNRYYFKNIVTNVLANSIATKETVVAKNPNLFPENKIKVIYNGININNFINKKYTPIYTKQNEDEIVITNLGRLELQKNQKFLVDLAYKLKKMNINFKMIIGGEGRLKQDLINQAKNLDVIDQIIFTGFIDNPKDLYYSGDIFILPSLWEGFGYVLAEASLCKKPILAFNISSNPEVVVDKKSGYLLEPDINIFAQKINDLKSNPSKMSEMGKFGFSFVNENFDSSTSLNKIEKFLIDDDDKKTKVSALLITYNEENNIEEILNDLRFTNEIIIIDSFSTDKTEELSKKYNNVTFIKRNFKNYTDQKSYALSLAKNNWILFLDADERISLSLKNEIIYTINSSNPAAAYFMYRIFMYKKEKINFSGTQRDKNYRLFQKNKVKFDPSLIVHETLIVNGNTKILNNKLLHYSYDSFDAYKIKMVRYGKMKAQEDFAKNKKATPFHLYIKPIGKFLEHYIIKLGVLDGTKGMIICYLYALSTRKRYTVLSKLHNGKQE
ncbi:glycosyltransferase [Cellulophaga sp. 20_2_10]|uniref:glycosyltransferase n=1 Tax=Cellulophaga sp. 20_2_10 TaxID=2942476 RepID=UPI00201A2C44|nr:glycosyltransferase [Cellulophaga sp. 20_2_10]MCL5245895.1 glycosyltransferase [Cellulophaga sp. 20_2_10]